MKKIIFPLLFLLLLFSFGCIKRDNPLDPNANSNIYIPQVVTNFQARALSSTTVKLTWDKRAGVNGYYIYRSMSQNGRYDRVDDNRLDNENYTEFLDQNPAFISGTFYWYKISAYKTYNGKNLEGYRSEPIYVYIP